MSNRSELNPEHPTTASLSGNWHKLLIALMLRYGWESVVLSTEDFERLAARANSADGLNITAREDEKGLHLTLVDDKTAQLLANS